MLYDTQLYLLQCCFCTTVCVFVTQILALFVHCASTCLSSRVGLTSFSHSPVLSGDLWGAVPDENGRVLQTGGIQSTAGVQLLTVYGKGVCVCVCVCVLTRFPVPLPTGGWASAAWRMVQTISSIRALSCLSDNTVGGRERERESIIIGDVPLITQCVGPH
jgi:hypothetical protein